MASRDGYIKVEVVIEPEPEAVSELSNAQKPLGLYHLVNCMVSNTRPGTMNVWVTRLNAKATVGYACAGVLEPHVVFTRATRTADAAHDGDHAGREGPPHRCSGATLDLG